MALAMVTYRVATSYAEDRTAQDSVDLDTGYNLRTDFLRSLYIRWIRTNRMTA